MPTLFLGISTRTQEKVDHGEQVFSAALVVIGLFVLVTTKGAILGLPISLIAVVLVLIGMRFGDDPWLKVRIDGKEG